jgi:hypothetical protein
VVGDPSERLGRPGLVPRLRPDVGAGVDDAVQPIQGLARRRWDPQRARRQRSGRPAPEREHQPRPDARGGPHADAAGDGRRRLPEDLAGTRAASPSRQVLGPDARPGT